MQYLSHALLLILALLGAFFKCVKEDPTGRPLRSRRGLPIPTVAGIVIGSLLVVSFLVSLRVTWMDNRAKARDTIQIGALGGAVERARARLDTLVAAMPGAQAPHQASFRVENRSTGPVSIWVDGQRADLQVGGEATLFARSIGSSVQLYSCGWGKESTEGGQAVGCRFISYDVASGQTWEIVDAKPKPRIVMKRVL